LNKRKSKNLRNKTLALFFTLGGSIETWGKMGYLSREEKIYSELGKHLGKIIFFTYGDKRELYSLLNNEIEVIPNSFGINSKIYSILLPLINFRELRHVDFIKTNQMRGSWAAIISKCIFQKPLIVRCGYEWVKFLQLKKTNKFKIVFAKIIENLTFRSADKIILTSKADKNFVMNKYHINQNKIILIPNYIDTSTFKPLNNVKKEKGRICFVGRLSKQKNLLNVLKAINGIEDIKLTIIGEGEMKKELENYTKKEKLHVEFMGQISNEKIPVKLNKSEFFIFPSIYEGNPKALLEAMACGLPVIASDIEAHRELIKHKINGYLCKTSVKSIAKAIKTLNDDLKLKSNISKNARLTIRSNFSISTLIGKELDVYKDL